MYFAFSRGSVIGSNSLPPNNKKRIKEPFLLIRVQILNPSCQKSTWIWIKQRFQKSLLFFFLYFIKKKHILQKKIFYSSFISNKNTSFKFVDKNM